MVVGEERGGFGAGFEGMNIRGIYGDFLIQYYEIIKRK